jgi:hypothetical protein
MARGHICGDITHANKQANQKIKNSASNLRVYMRAREASKLQGNIRRARRDLSKPFVCIFAPVNED